jgi:RNA polymerase sigma factor (sigma-70 family)
MRVNLSVVVEEVRVNPLTQWPIPDEEHQLLTQLDAGTPTAREELAVRYLPLLMHFLARAFPRVAADLRDDAADRALIDFLCSRHRFDPTRATLGTYLRVAARRDLLNLLDRERRVRRGIPLDSGAEPADHRNNTRDDELAWDHPRLAAELAAFDTQERVAYELILGGVRDTATFARRLNLEHLPAAERVNAVKRVKDRVKRRLVRAVEDCE